MYITLDEYECLYDPIEERVFNILVFDACRLMDNHTTGIDNIRKLKKYYPTEEYADQAIKHCAAKLVNFLYQIREAEMNAQQCRGFEITDQGVRGKVITSVTAGNESISYSAGYSSTSSAALTAAESAARDKTVRDKLVAEIIWEGLSGVEDANGVNLLFMGRYPRRYGC